VPYCQKYTPTDCFFGHFAHWEYSVDVVYVNILISICQYTNEDTSYRDVHNELIMIFIDNQVTADSEGLEEGLPEGETGADQRIYRTNRITSSRALREDERGEIDAVRVKTGQRIPAKKSPDAKGN